TYSRDSSCRLLRGAIVPKKSKRIPVVDHCFVAFIREAELQPAVHVAADALLPVASEHDLDKDIWLHERFNPSSDVVKVERAIEGIEPFIDRAVFEVDQAAVAGDGGESKLNDDGVDA